MNKLSDVDEAVISIAYDLFSDGVDLKIIMKHLDNRGVISDDITFSKEINEGQKIEFLQAIIELKKE